jgi:betaine-aldehyde dehydrogenase
MLGFRNILGRTLFIPWANWLECVHPDRSCGRNPDVTAPRALRNFINGEFCDARSERRLDVVNPATGRGRRSVRGVGARPLPSERQQALFKFADADRGSHADEFVDLESENTGKPLAPPSSPSEEVPPMIDQIRFFAGAARHPRGRRGRRVHEGPHVVIRREPIGVVASGRPPGTTR